jgi:hypothetical protein
MKQLQQAIAASEKQEKALRDKIAAVRDAAVVL